MNKKIIIIFTISMIIFACPILATNFNFYRDDGTSGTTFDVGYEGDMSEIPNHVVKNLNALCKITCTFVTSQGRTEIVPGVSGGYIPASSSVTSPRFSLPIVAQGSKTLTTTMTCHDEDSTLCSSSNSYTLPKQMSLTWDYCGDGIIQASHETCDGGSKSCSQIEGKYYASKSAPCKSDCSGYNTGICEYCGDGIKNGAETCDDGSRNNQVCSPSYDSSCTYCSNSCSLLTKQGAYCGDRNRDTQENCGNCPQDASCEDGPNACSGSICLDLDSNENCGAIGKRCNINPQEASTGNIYCSSDNTKAISVSEVTTEKCVNKQCQKDVTNQNKETDCTGSGTYCQDGKCGCKAGFDACTPLGQCVETSVSENGASCACDFQCKSGICENQICIEGLISTFNSQKSVIRPNEETGLSFAVKNPFNFPITASLIVKFGSGVGTSALLSGQDCRGSQCTSSLPIPAGGNADISLTLQGNNIGEVPVQAMLSYNLKDKTRQPMKEIKILITECGEVECKTQAQSMGILQRIFAWLSKLF